MSHSVVPASYRIGPQHWMKSDKGWYVQMWGWWPGDTQSRPSWQWVKIEDDRVPQDLIKRWKEDNR